MKVFNIDKEGDGKMKQHDTTKGKKRPVKKLIALWIVFAMLIVPFSSHVGPKQGSKAEGPEGGVIPSTVQTTPQEIEKTFNLTVTSDSTTNDITSSVATDTKVLLRNAQKYSFKIPSITLNGAALITGQEGAENNDDLVYKRFPDADALSPNLESAGGTENLMDKIGTGGNTGTPITLEESGIYGIYLRIHGDTTYRLVAKIDLTYNESAFSEDDVVKSGNQVKENGAYLNDINVELANNSSPFHGTTGYRYYFKTDSEAESTALETAGTYGYSNYFANASGNGKMVYVYAALVSNETPNNRVLEYKQIGYYHVSDDTQAPNVLGELGVKSGSSFDYNTTEITDHTSGGYYYGISEAYCYKITATDTAPDVRPGEIQQDVSGVASVSIKIGNNTAEPLTKAADDCYYYQMTKAQVVAANGAAVKVIATDNKGNTKTADLTKIKQVSTTPTFTEAKIGNEVLNGYKIIGKQPNKKSLKVTVRSINAIADMQLQSGSTVLTKKENSLNAGNLNSDKRTKDYSAEFEIPEDLSTSITYSGFKVYVKIGDAFVEVEDSTLNDILYDATKPVISNPVLQKHVIGQVGEDGKETWTTIAGTNAITTAHGYEYRYGVTVTNSESDESGTKRVYLDQNNPNTYFTQDGTTNFWYGVIPDNVLPTDRYFQSNIYAEDNAGNVSDGVQLRPIRKIDDSLTFDNVQLVVIDDEGNTTEELDENQGISVKNNQKIKLKYTISSSYTIHTVTIRDKRGEASTYTKETEFSAADNGAAHDDDNRYYINAEFILPEGTDNADLKNLYLFATDNKPRQPQTKRFPENGDKFIGDILYDRTKPVLTYSNEPENKWYNEQDNFELNYTVKSGTQTDESNLSSVTYSLSDCVGATTDPVSVSVNGTSLTSKIKIPESTSVNGTVITFEAKDECENILKNDASCTRTIKVDKTAPKVNLVTINGKTDVNKPVKGEVVIATQISDNLTIQAASMTIVGPEVDKTVSIMDAADGVGITKDYSITLKDLIGKDAIDGNYLLTVSVTDKARHTTTKDVLLTVDNTIPVVTAKITSGSTASKQPGTNFDGTPCDYYYSSNVGVLLTYEDENMKDSNVVVTDNGNRVTLNWDRIGKTAKYQANYIATKEGPHTIQISAKDNAGNEAVKKQIVFVRDTAAPVISAVLNGGTVYSEGMGNLDLTAAPTLTFSVNDANEDVMDFNYQLIKTAPDTLPVTADYLKTDNRRFSYTDEADYEINVFAVDKAGNRSALRNVRFRVDTAAPELTISGASSGTALSDGVTLTFTMVESFWKDASGTVTITRKPGDGQGEVPYKTIEYTPTGRTTSISEALTETGEYTVTFTGKDRVGHTSEATAYTVKIDRDKPVVILSGVSNNNKTTGSVEFEASVEDNFYLTKTISIKATRTYLDAATNKEKTEDVKFTGYNPTDSKTIIRNKFTEDGIYKIEILCKDEAGNQDVQEVSFTIDKTKPVIDSKVLGAYEGTLTSFTWDYDLNDIIHDLTVCEAHMYLNGSEYDGTSEVEDGTYEMKIVAEDELGNTEEYVSSFLLDTKAPTFIVTGVEDGDIKNEQYTIDVSLQLDEDILDSVFLNDTKIDIKDNKANITVTKKGEYKLTMKAHDAAGNEAEKTISFKYGEKSQWWIFLIAGIAAVLVIGGIIIVVARKKNEK